jgi:hypothetical protein
LHHHKTKRHLRPDRDAAGDGVLGARCACPHRVISLTNAPFAARGDPMVHLHSCSGRGTVCESSMAGALVFFSQHPSVRTRRSKLRPSPRQLRILRHRVRHAVRHPSLLSVAHGSQRAIHRGAISGTLVAIAILCSMVAEGQCSRTLRAVLQLKPRRPHRTLAPPALAHCEPG